MLNPMMPDDVAVKPIPRQDWYSISEVYRFQHFQGIALARRLHLVVQVLNIFFWILLLVSTFDEDALVVIAAIIICPILLVVYACFIRLICELIISVLLIPPLLAKNQPLGPAGAQMGNDSDLAAYGVSNGGDDMGTAV